MPRLQTRDIIIYYEEAGDGYPLLLITGLGGDLQSWAFNAPDLAKQFKVVTFDNRGAGRTSAPDRPYTIDGMADDAAGLLDALEIEKAHVLGFSMGGCIAQELALRHPSRVDKLVLVSSVASIEGYVRAMVEGLMTVRRSNISREGFVRVMAPLIYIPSFLDDPARLDRAIQNTLANPYPQQDHAYLRQAQALLRFDTSSRLGDIKQQALVLHGADDVLVPSRNGKRLAEGLPAADYKELPGGHAGLFEHANEYNEAVMGFLSVAAAAPA
jgi:3-oxoadipate enol-lactonase